MKSHILSNQRNIPLYKQYVRLFSWIVLLHFVSPEINAETIMHAYGTISVSPYVHGIKPSRGRYHGYRSEFLTQVDFFRINRFVFQSLLGNTTIITSPDNRGMKLDRIRYTLSPGIRYERETWLVRGILHHECIHTINRPEMNGSTWWNSIQLGIGTKGSYNQFLHQKYAKPVPKRRDNFDAQITIGYILPANRTLFSGQNHDFRFEQFSVIRYRIVDFGKWLTFAGLRQNLWMKEDQSSENQISITVSGFMKGLESYIGVFYSYALYDSFSLDNSDKLGSLGFRIIY